MVSVTSSRRLRAANTKPARNNSATVSRNRTAFASLAWLRCCAAMLAASVFAGSSLPQRKPEAQNFDSLDAFFGMEPRCAGLEGTQFLSVRAKTIRDLESSDFDSPMQSGHNLVA